MQIIASEIEAPFIMGEKKSLRLIQAEETLKTLPEAHKPFGLAFCDLLMNVEASPVDLLVKEGDLIDCCGGCEIIATPGHTPGHISIYLKKHKTMVTGDAAVLQGRQLVVANPEFALNLSEAVESLEKLKDYKADTYICYHGGVYQSI